MATIASLSVDLSANTAKFRSGLGEAKGALSSFVGSVASIAGGSLLAQGIEAAVGKMKELVVHSFETIDSVAKMSDKIGIATEDLLNFQYAAGQAGVNTETFNGAMLHMQKNIGEASVGTEGAVSAFESVGISIEDIVQMNPADAFKTVTNAIKDLGSPAQRVSAAMAIFGKQGSELIPLLIQGSEGLDEMAKRNEELGGSFNRIDAEKVVMAGDAMQDLGKFIENVAKHIAIQLSPFIKAATDELISFGTSGSTVGEKVTGAFEMVAKGIATVADYFEFLKAGWYAAQAAITKGIEIFLRGLNLVAGTIENIYEAVTGHDLGIQTFFNEMTNGLSQEADKSLKAFDEAYANFQNGNAAQNVSAFFDKIKAKATEAATESAKKAAEAAKNVGDVVDTEYEKRMQKLQKLAEKIFDKTRTPLEKFKADVMEVAEVFKAGLIDDDTFQRAVKMARDEVDKANKETKSKGDGSFKQIDTQNISIEGLKARKETQQVRDPQLEKTNAILLEIKKNMGSGSVAVLGT